MRQRKSKLKSWKEERVADVITDTMSWLLVYACHRRGGVTSSWLLENFTFSPVRLENVIVRIEQFGFIKRIRETGGDTLICLTPEGRDIVRSVLLRNHNSLGNKAKITKAKSHRDSARVLELLKKWRELSTSSKMGSTFAPDLKIPGLSIRTLDVTSMESAFLYKAVIKRVPRSLSACEDEAPGTSKTSLSTFQSFILERTQTFEEACGNVSSSVDIESWISQ